MNVSSATSVLPQAGPTPATANPNKAEDKVEGNKPDNDNDRDDTVNSSTQATNATGTVGTQVNITA